MQFHASSILYLLSSKTPSTVSNDDMTGEGGTDIAALNLYEAAAMWGVMRDRIVFVDRVDKYSHILR